MVVRILFLVRRISVLLRKRIEVKEIRLEKKGLVNSLPTRVSAARTLQVEIENILPTSGRNVST